MPKRRRPWKKVTQTWQYKGPIPQPKEQEKVEKQEQEDNIRTQEKQQEKDKEIVQKEDQQTPKNATQVEGQLDLSLENFPMLKAIPTRNGFESLMHTKMTSLTVDRGGVPKTC